MTDNGMMAALLKSILRCLAGWLTFFKTPATVTGWPWILMTLPIDLSVPNRSTDNCCPTTMPSASSMNWPSLTSRLAIDFNGPVLPTIAAFWVSTLPSRAFSSLCKKAMGAVLRLGIFPKSLTSCSVSVLTVVDPSASVKMFAPVFCPPDRMMATGSLVLIFCCPPNSLVTLLANDNTMVILAIPTVMPIIVKNVRPRLAFKA